MMRRWLDSLGELSRPLFGQMALAVTLLCGVPLVGYFLNHRYDAAMIGERAGPVSAISVLPDSFLLRDEIHEACASLFFIGALAWWIRILIPWTAWLTVAGFTGVVALYLERSIQVTHVAHITNMVLVIQAFWTTCYRNDIREAGVNFWKTPLYPKWASELVVAYIGLFYGMSGWMKVATSGLDWPNGVSMQLWTKLWGDPNSMWTRLILEHRSAAIALQWGALIIECTAPLAIVPRLRPWIGLGLIGFHVGQVAVFGWGFHANMILIAIYFLPVQRWIQNRRSEPTCQPSTMALR